MLNHGRNARLQIGAFVVDAETEELLSDEKRVAIQKKPFELLLALLEAPGELVLRDDLYKRLWPGVAADYRRGLDTAVKKLRRALGDRERDPEYIETLPRRGYRLIARVHPVGEEPLIPEVQSGAVYPRTPVELPPDSQANRLYLQGYHCWNKKTPDALRNALAFFEQARHLEPGDSRFWTATAHAYVSIAIRGVMRPSEAIENARAAVARALTLNHGDLFALVLVTWLRGAFDYDLLGSAEALERSVAADSMDRSAIAALVFVLTALGRHREAHRHIETAHRLDPVSPTLYAMRGYVLYFAGDLTTAERLGRAAVQRDPEFGLWRFYYAQPLLASGNAASAVEQLRKAAEQQGTPDVLALLGCACVSAGARDRAEEIDRQLETVAGKEYVDAYHRALLKDALGDRETAVRLLEQAADDHCHWFALAAVDPKLNGLRADERVKRLLLRLRT